MVMELGGGVWGEACLGTRHCGWPLQCQHPQEGVGVSGTFSVLICFYNSFLSSCDGKLPPDMVDGGPGPGHTRPLGGGGRVVAQVLCAPGTLQEEQKLEEF